jgi:hypothetical protein
MDTRNDMPDEVPETVRDDDIDYDDYKTKVDRIVEWAKTTQFDDLVSYEDLQDYCNRSIERYSTYSLSDNTEFTIDMVYYDFGVVEWYSKNRR